MVYIILGTLFAVVWTTALAAMPWIQDWEMKRKAAPAPRREPAPEPVPVHAH